MNNNEIELIKRTSKYENQKQIPILSTDGAFISVSEEQIRLLFFTNVPFLQYGDDGDRYIEEKKTLQVEIRMPLSGIQEMIPQMLKGITDAIENEEDTHSNSKNTDQMPLEVV